MSAPGHSFQIAAPAEVGSLAHLVFKVVLAGYESKSLAASLFFFLL